MRVTGIHVSKGSLYVATVDFLDGNVSQANRERVNPSATLRDADAFVDLRDRVRQHLAAQVTSGVGIVETRRHNSWSYRDAYRRVFAVCAVFEASAQLNLACETVKTQHIAENVGLPAKSLNELPWDQVGFVDKPTHWNAGFGEAFSCAIHLCRSGSQADDE